MSDEIIDEIDSLLAAELPEDPRRHDGDISEDRKREIVQLLQYAADEVGRSPSSNEFDALDLEVSARKIQDVFGSWNEAKRAAGLETYEVGEGTDVYLAEDYFETVDTAETAYWLGTLFATSSIQVNDENFQYTLNLARTEDKDFFVRAFAEAIDSEYAIHAYENAKTGSTQLALQISNRAFIDSLTDLGYPGPDGEASVPALSEGLRAPFVRGYVESSPKSFTGNPVRIAAPNRDVAETLKQWIEAFGVTRPSVTDRQSDGVGVNVSNEFNIKALYEALWPEGPETTPSFAPYPESVLAYLESEYPYPENVDYLSGE